MPFTFSFSKDINLLTFCIFIFVQIILVKILIYFYSSFRFGKNIIYF